MQRPVLARPTSKPAAKASWRAAAVAGLCVVECCGVPFAHLSGLAPSPVGLQQQGQVLLLRMNGCSSTGKETGGGGGAGPPYIWITSMVQGM
ncbi:hypothetical protein GQ54DRAFT_67770 [Martensiomyces pterosporus]|nr:hypothetical protein GQ54DRAFT_67770 [Martensiomyces pterosporus]